MKTLLLALLVLAGISFRAQAQYVTIPDAAFVSFLQAELPGCMNGNQMDTTCSSILNKDSLNCSSRNIQSLTGIEYFDSLKILVCSSNSLTSLPRLPQTLTKLTCDRNQLTSLPTLPSGMTHLNSERNELSSLPALQSGLINVNVSVNELTILPVLPASLVVLRCTHNYQLTSLPALPGSLTYLDCSFNPITTLPTLPNSLVNLGIVGCSLTSLTLPAGLNMIQCGGNPFITPPVLPANLKVYFTGGGVSPSLPVLPNSLIQIDVSTCNLTSLPAQLPSGLMFLNCRNNQLTSLPPLASTLFYLECSENQLATLPALPAGLNTLFCNDNLLTSSPPLPNNLKEARFQNNLLTTVPSLSALQGTVSSLNFSNNHITGFQNFPNACTTFNISNNPLTCLPTITQISNLTFTNTLVNCVPNHRTMTSNPDINTLPICSTACAALANYAFIPDTNFGTWLNTNGFSACMLGNNSVGWFMDTTCPAVITDSLVDVSGQNIQDLTGIQYFDNLRRLICYNNQLTKLPALPNTINQLFCDSNRLTSLPVLPSSLRLLWVKYNQLTTLPALPNSLQELDCRNNQLTSLPDLDNGDLYEIYCSNNRLTSLPPLPDILLRIVCDSNLLTTLPSFSNIHHNSYDVDLLSFNNNLITGFPDFPDTCGIFMIDNNPLTCLPLITDMDALYFSNTLVSCVLNYDVFLSVPDVHTFPICLPGEGCDSTVNTCTGFSLQVTSARSGALPDTLCATVTGGTAPYTYNWNGNVTGLPNQCFELTSGAFSITVTDSAGCVATFSMDSLCDNQCVWPGDADYNGIADNIDLLPIGLAYGKTGTARAQQDINWYAHPAQPWIDTITTTGTGTAGTNLFTISSSAGISLGMAVSGNGIGTGAVVTSIAGTTIAVSIPNAGTVSGTLTFITPSISSSVNSKQIDCDGNGIVEAADTLAIIQNFGRLHAKGSEQRPWRMIDPILYVDLASDTTRQNDTLHATILLGDVNIPANDVYGLAFTVNYDITVVDTTKTQVAFGDSWLGTAADKISIQKDLKVSGQLKCAVTRIDHNKRSGYGAIGKINFIITTDNINGKDLGYYPTQVWITDVLAIDNLGNSISVNEGIDSVVVEYDPIGISNTQLRDDYLKMQPNPATDEVLLVLDHTLLGAELKLHDMNGKLLLTKTITTTNEKLFLSEFRNGIYFVQILSRQGVLTKRLAIVR